MSARDTFFFIAGVLALAVLLPLFAALVRSGATGPAPRRTLAFGIAAVAVVLGAAFGLYEWLGSPATIGRSAVAQRSRSTTATP